MPTIDDILKSITTAQGEAKASNEQRYSQLLDLWTNQRQRGNRQLTRAGNTFRNRITNVNDMLQESGTAATRKAVNASQEAVGQGTQDLIDRGLYNTTTLDSMRSKAATDLGDQTESIRENTDNRRASAYLQTSGDLANFQLNRTGVESGLTGQLAGVIERRTDQYPALDTYASLLKQLSQAEAGTGGRSVTSGNFNTGSGGGGGGGGRSSGGGSGGSPSFGGSGGGGGDYGYSGGSGGYGGGAGSVDSGGFGGGFSSDNMVLPGSTMYLGGRSLGSNGEIQGSGSGIGGDYNSSAATLNQDSYIRTNYGDGSFAQAGNPQEYANQSEQQDQQNTPMPQSGNFTQIGAGTMNADPNGSSGGQSGQVIRLPYGMAVPSGYQIISTDLFGTLVRVP